MAHTNIQNYSKHNNQRDKKRGVDNNVFPRRLAGQWESLEFLVHLVAPVALAMAALAAIIGSAFSISPSSSLSDNSLTSPCNASSKSGAAAIKLTSAVFRTAPPTKRMSAITPAAVRMQA